MGWAQATTLIVAVITGAGAVVAAAVTYGLTQRAGRRERQEGFRRGTGNHRGVCQYALPDPATVV